MTKGQMARSLSATLLAGATALSGFAATKAQADMVSTGAAIANHQILADKERLLGELQSQTVRDELIALGVDPAEAEARLAAMTDAEIAARLATLDEDPAGASDIIGALLTVFIILLITDLLCLTDVFKFTRTC